MQLYGSQSASDVGGQQQEQGQSRLSRLWFCDTGTSGEARALGSERASVIDEALSLYGEAHGLTGLAPTLKR